MALDFDATDDALTLASAGVTAAPISIHAWAHSDDVTQNAVIGGVFSGNGTQNHGFWISHNASKLTVNAQQHVTATGTATGATTISNTTWYSVLGVCSAADARKIYLNGVEDGTNSTPATPASIDRTETGAYYADASNARIAFWNGRIAEFAIWNAALTAEEAVSLAKGHSPALIRPASLVYYTPLVRLLTNLKGTMPTATGTTVADHPRVIAHFSYRS